MTANSSASAETSSRVASDSLSWTPYDIAIQTAWGTLVVGIIIGLFKAWHLIRERARIGAEYAHALAANPSHPHESPDRPNLD